jgi:hypothetical protein
MQKKVSGKIEAVVKRLETFGNGQAIRVKEPLERPH